MGISQLLKKTDFLQDEDDSDCEFNRYGLEETEDISLQEQAAGDKKEEEKSLVELRNKHGETRIQVMDMNKKNIESDLR